MNSPAEIKNNRGEITSPFSKKKGAEIWGSKEGKSVYRCPETGVLFFDRNDLIRCDYQEYYPYLKDFDFARIEWEVDIRRSKIRNQLKLMEHFVSGKKVVDIGAGPGYLCYIARNEGWEAIGNEASEEAKRFGRKHFGVCYKGLEEIENNSADVVVCHHVLEHIINPIAFLKEVKEKLKKKGLLVIHVPCVQSFTFKVKDFIARVLNKNRDRVCNLYGNEHISGFTKESLKIFITRQGFGVHFVRGAGMWSQFYDPFFWKNYLRDKKWGAMIKKFIKHVIENIGGVFGSESWVVGYFYKY
jgi:SAM-dependent methyltransferase